MTAAEFTAFLDRHGWNQTQAAAHLGVTQQAVSLWQRGERTIPGTVEKLIECLERNEESERK